MKISEVNIILIKPRNGLIGFASLVVNDALYLGSIGIHQKLNGNGYRLTYPTKKTGAKIRRSPGTRQHKQFHYAVDSVDAIAWMPGR